MTRSSGKSWQFFSPSFSSQRGVLLLHFPPLHIPRPCPRVVSPRSQAGVEENKEIHSNDDKHAKNFFGRPD